jgi:hypothetical protein
MKTKNTAETKVAKIPKCNICGEDAEYDGKTTMGPWAFMCQADFEFFGVGLGTGLGQRLVLAD